MTLTPEDVLNIGFIVFLAGITLFTPKESGNKAINGILTAKFALFIGVFFYLRKHGYTDGDYFYLFKSALDMGFLWVFYRLKAYFLAFLCLQMAAYHIFHIFVPLNYLLIMGIFQILQLIVALEGMINGRVAHSASVIPDSTLHTGHKEWRA